MAEEYSVAEAAVVLGVSERTLREWVRSGKAAAHVAPAPQRGKRITLEEVERLRPLVPADSGRPPQPAGSEQRQPPVDSGEPRQTAADSGKLHEVEKALAAAQAELRAVSGERDHLREQIGQHIQAEAEMRVLLLRQSEQITKLQDAQEQKALPEPKRQWWQPPGGEQGQELRPWWRFWG